MYLEGKLTHRTWQDKDGNNRKTTEVVASYFRALNRREGEGNSGYFPGTDDEMPYSETSITRETESAPAHTTPPAPEMDADDDLPF